MKKIYLFIGISSFILMTSCTGNKTNKTSDNKTTKVASENCFYSYDSVAGAQVHWTAFKTTEKKPVGGQFDQVIVTAGKKSSQITDLLKTVRFNIPTSSTNTGVKDRDAKIINFFFNAMESTDIISGKVKNVEGDNTGGTCIFDLTLNNVEKEVSLNYTVADTIITITGEINVSDFGADNAVASLNKACEVLHKGADGVSKTWPNVELSIETKLKKDCM